jgi:hypothetical protein
VGDGLLAALEHAPSSPPSSEAIPALHTNRLITSFIRFVPNS